MERLLAPRRAAPHSLAGQLRFIRDHWAGWLDRRGLLDRLTLELGILARRRRWRLAAQRRRPTSPRRRPAGAPTAAASGAWAEVEAFSPDKDWMPNLVLMAKSTYVWLDQLSRTYGRPSGRSTRSRTRSSTGCASAASRASG